MPDTAPAEWSFATLKQHIDTALASRDAIARDLRVDDKEALRVAFDANNKRLDGMNEIRSSLSDLSNKMILRTEAEGAINAAAGRLDAQISAGTTNQNSEMKNLSAKLDALGKTNWTFILSVASLVFGIIAGGSVVISLKIDAANAPLSLSIERIKGGDDGRDKQLANAASRIELAQDADRLHALEQTFAAGRSVREAGFTEVRERIAKLEAQGHAMSNASNVAHDDSDRWTGLLWEKVFGSRMPRESYRPDLSGKGNDP